jgi:hypothetical protein
MICQSEGDGKRHRRGPENPVSQARLGVLDVDLGTEDQEGIDDGDESTRQDQNECIFVDRRTGHFGLMHFGETY